MRAAAAACLLLFLLSPAASAYTLVMRGGRRVVIPDTFRLTQSQLTYETAPGVAVTLALDLVDVAATERENGDPAGGFYRRAVVTRDTAERPAARARQKGPAVPSRPVARTLTNRELEPARRARVESERAYERRRAELGLPSAEESRRRDGEEEKAMRERARRKAEEDEGAEVYWRERAAALHEEAGALDAEINYLRGLLATSSDNSSAGFSSATGLTAAALTVFAGPRASLGRGGYARVFPAPPFAARNPANFGLQNFGVGRYGRAPVGASLGVKIGGGTRTNFGLVGRGGGGRFARQTHRGRFTHRRSQLFAAGVVGIVAPFDYASADASALVTRLWLLEGERAGLGARLRHLEDEARRAGAHPGWLRP